jgi:hypothetical protein
VKLAVSRKLTEPKRVDLVWKLNLIPFFGIGLIYAGGTDVVVFMLGVYLVELVSFVTAGANFGTWLMWYIMLSVCGMAKVYMHNYQLKELNDENEGPKTITSLQSSVSRGGSIHAPLEDDLGDSIVLDSFRRKVLEAEKRLKQNSATAEVSKSGGYSTQERSNSEKFFADLDASAYVSPEVLNVSNSGQHDADRDRDERFDFVAGQSVELLGTPHEDFTPGDAGTLNNFSASGNFKLDSLDASDAQEKFNAAWDMPGNQSSEKRDDFITQGNDARDGFLTERKDDGEQSAKRDAFITQGNDARDNFLSDGNDDADDFRSTEETSREVTAKDKNAWNDSWKPVESGKKLKPIPSGQLPVASKPIEAAPIANPVPPEQVQNFMGKLGDTVGTTYQQEPVATPSFDLSFPQFEAPKFSFDFSSALENFSSGTTFAAEKKEGPSQSSQDECQRCGSAKQSDFAFCLGCGISF